MNQMHENSTRYFCSLKSYSNLSDNSIIILNKSTSLLNRYNFITRSLYSEISNNSFNVDPFFNYYSNKELLAYYVNKTKTHHYYWLFFILIEILVLVGNGCLIFLILLNKSLYNNNTTRIVLSLSVTDLLLSIFVMPFTLYSQISFSRWDLGYGMCLIWFSSDIQLTTTSIFHLCSISYERYLSIAKPIVFRSNIKRRIAYLILSNWLLSFFLVTLPFIVLSAIDMDIYVVNKNQYLNSKTYSCIFSSNKFIVYSTVITFWLPMIFMIFFGTKTMLLIRKLDRSHSSFHSTKNGLESTIKTSVAAIAIEEKMNLMTKSILNKSKTECSKDDLKNDNIDSIKDLNDNQIIVNESNDNENGGNVKRIKFTDFNENDSENCSIDVLHKNINKNDEKITSTLSLSSTKINKSYSSKSKKEKSQDAKLKRRRFSDKPKINKFSNTIRKNVFKNLVTARKEQQAQKTLSIVLIIFVLSYFPLFTFITAMSLIEILNNYNVKNDSDIEFSKYICLIMMPQKQLDNHSQIAYYNPQKDNSILVQNQFLFLNVIEENEKLETKTDLVFYLTTWLAYSSAVFNPILHLLFNSNFKNAFISCFKK